jgi:hypothetical protein
MPIAMSTMLYVRYRMIPIDLTLQDRGEREGLVLGPHQEGDGGGHDEDEADREEHLVELAGRVEAGVEQTLEHRTDRRDGQEPEEEGRREAEAPVLHCEDDRVSPEHGEAAMGEVDEAHQAHGDQPHRR